HTGTGNPGHQLGKQSSNVGHAKIVRTKRSERNPAIASDAPPIKKATIERQSAAKWCARAVAQI
ncbi:hypothetical protein, partial [Sphingopyxis sp. Root214]|uniref:hypothetical protein n=1 Tax=Sphingopyxis sp. Root214 TaxID=1736491 RepID=UPI001F1F483F